MSLVVLEVVLVVIVVELLLLLLLAVASLIDVDSSTRGAVRGAGLSLESVLLLGRVCVLVGGKVVESGVLVSLIRCRCLGLLLWLLVSLYGLVGCRVGGRQYSVPGTVGRPTCGISGRRF